MPRTRNPKRKYKRRRLYKKGAKRTKSFRKAVQKIINKNVEDKQAFISQGSTSFNSGISGSADMYNVVPYVINGTVENTRVGDQIKAKRLVIKGAVLWNPSGGWTYSNARLAVRIFIVQPKNYCDYVSVYNNPSWLSSLLKRGNTVVPFTGTLQDLWTPVNKDAVTVYYDKVLYLNGLYQGAAGTTPILGSTKFFSKTIKFRMSGKTFRYDPNASSGTSPTNFGPVLVLGYTHMDGSGADTLTTAVTASYDSVLYFQDA